MIDIEKFPHPVYAETVLGPLFEGVKAHYADHMAAINEAHLVMLAQTGILPAGAAEEIARALAGIARETDISALIYTGEYEDYFFFVEAELKRRLGDDLAGMLHTARSRNDMDHTVFKMALRTRADAMLVLLSQLAQAMLDKARAEAQTPIVAYTHGQPAQVSTFGHYLSAALEVLLSDIARLLAARASLDLCPMGAAAIDYHQRLSHRPAPDGRASGLCRAAPQFLWLYRFGGLCHGALRHAEAAVPASGAVGAGFSVLDCV